MHWLLPPRISDARLANSSGLAHRMNQMIAVSPGMQRDLPWLPGSCRSRIDSDVRTAAILGSERCAHRR